MRMYLVKYALTRGVSVVDGKLRTIDPGSKHLRVGNGVRADFYRVGVDVFGSWDAAKAACERMRVKKLASLERQMAKIEALVFERPDD